MLELVVLGAFAAALLICVAAGYSVLYALLVGYALFFGYGLLRKFSPSQLLSMSWAGVKRIAGMLLVFLLIGMITAVWRACGTIPFIIYHASAMVAPSVFVLIAFLLCCLISALTGTAFGTSATVGVICMTLATAMGISVPLTGGAILAGSYFGDRCSPMSTSALLVAQLTDTDIYVNIKHMLRTSVVPFALTCALYLALGRGQGDAGVPPELWGLFPAHFNLHGIVVLPALLIILLCLLRIKVKYAMIASILSGCAIGLVFQNIAPLDLLRLLAFGFRPADDGLAAMMTGGGIASMVHVMIIVCLSSSYAGIFEGTGLLDGIKAHIARLSLRVTPFGSLLIAASLTCMVTCNQTLSIILTHHLCRDIVPDRQLLAVHLENTAVVIPPLVPWSIASAVTLSAIGAPAVSILAAFYLYLLPLWNLWVQLKQGTREATPSATH